MVFQDTFHKKYALSSYVEAHTPMPEDGGHWSALHSSVMATPFFLEFMMFFRSRCYWKMLQFDQGDMGDEMCVLGYGLEDVV
uniref:Glycosyl transferase n=1 Tax=Tanacetum cinerariifolium TaxID=118510 RepID=A0A699KF73_TANCI|nr:glycosyl transferase [Tanacetum cinerariifolium]